MNAVMNYVWIEWRQQRMVILFLAIGLLSVTVLMHFALGGNDISHPANLGGVSSIVVGTTLLTVGSDLFARQKNGTQLQFLQRLPNGLNLAFRGKLAFFLLLLLGAVLFSYLLRGLIVLYMDQPPHSVGNGMSPKLWRAMGFSLVGCLWVFAVSTWSPSSVMALPLTGFFGWALSYPVKLMPGQFQLSELYPDGLRVLMLLSLSATAILSARYGFVKAAPRDWPRVRAFTACLCMAVIGFFPLYGFLAIGVLDTLN